MMVQEPAVAHRVSAIGHIIGLGRSRKDMHLS